MLFSVSLTACTGFLGLLQHSCSWTSRLFVYSVFVKIFDHRLIKPVLHTVAHKQLLINSDVSEHDHLQRMLRSVVTSRRHSRSSKLYISLTRSQSPSLQTVLVFRLIPRIADLSHGTDWSWKHPRLSPLSLTVSSKITELQSPPTKQLRHDLHIPISGPFRHLRSLSDVCVRR